MNKKILAPIAVLAALALKDYFGVDVSGDQLEEALELIVAIAAGVWAAVSNPKK